MLIFIACCGVPSCFQYHQDPVRGVVRGREKNSVATVVMFLLVGGRRCMQVAELGILL